MNDISLRMQNIIPEMRVGTIPQAYKALAEHAMTLTGLPSEDVLEALQNDTNDNAGIGDGIALLHGRMHGLRESHLFVARLVKPIAYKAVDDEPIDLIFFLLSPVQEAKPFHLRRLARVSRVVRDSALLRRMRGSDRVEALYSLLHEPVTQAKAA